MVIDAGTYYNKIHAGVTIAGQSVSGLTRDEATSRLDQFVTQAQESPITLTSGGKNWPVQPDSVGTDIDVVGAVSAALNITRGGNSAADLVNKLKLYFGGRDVPLEGTVDPTSLDAVIDPIASELDQPAVNAALTMRGATVEAVEGKDGLVVDKDALRQKLTETLLSLHSTEIEIPLVVDTPDVQVEDNQAAFAQTKTIIGAPLTLTSGELSWTFTPQEVASYVDFSSKDEGGVSTLVPYISAEKMATKLAEISAQAATEPVNATFASDGKKVWVVPAVDGTTIDPQKTSEALTVAALQTSGRTAQAEVMTKEADLTTAEAEAMGIKDRLSTYTTPKYAGTENRQINVRLTVKYVLAGKNGLLAPGEEFSFKEAVGPRTPERGYKKAPGITPGIQLEDVYGGGICQVSTTMFNAVILAGLKVTERRNHTLYIDHYPTGRDATVTDEGADLRFVNNTTHNIWITGKSDGKTTTITIWGTSDGRKVDIQVGDWYGIWGPYTHTTLDPSLPTGRTLVMVEGQKAKMCMLTVTVTWPDGKKEKWQSESNYKHVFKLVKVGTGTTTTTVYVPTTTPTTAYIPGGF
jgi:vancomycin resistance protein YoaR